MKLSHFITGPNLEQRMAETEWRPSGFDYMRIVLSVSVILAHTRLIGHGQASYAGSFYEHAETLARMIVPMFFALSGFLVAGSLERSKTLVTFLGLRIYRILPALTMEVLLSALILGPIFTTLPLSDYYASGMFHNYFFNIIGEIHYYLPGVFDQNPFQQVNGQLWTVPYELICYVVLSGFSVLGIFRRRVLLLAMLVLYHGAQIINTIYRPHVTPSAPTGSIVVMCFIAGLALYRYRDRIVWSKGLALAALAISLFLISVPNGIRFCAIPISYLTIYLGLLNPPRNKILLSGDYSYGIYLYGFPIQQALVASAPIFAIWWVNFLSATCISALMACFSWWVVEKPILNQRQFLKNLEARYLQLGFVQKMHFYLNKYFGSGSRK